MEPNYHAVVFEGETTVDKVAKFRDKIQQAAKEHLHLLIDLSEIDHLPSISGAIIGDLLDKLLKSYYHIVILNVYVLGERFMETHEETETFKFFDNYTDAEDFFASHPVKVLVVEDEEISARMIENYLQSHNLIVIRAVSGEEAIDLSQSEKPHLILMDIHLPEMSGLEAAQFVRGHPDTCGIPIIMLTSDSDREKVESAMQLSVEGYIRKPFNPQTFFSKLLEVLAGSEN